MSDWIGYPSVKTLSPVRLGKIVAIDKSLFWNINETLTHSEALFFVITGTRGCGKSFGCKKRAIENFLKKGEQFGYIRRYEKDLDEAYKEFYKDIVVVFAQRMKRKNGPKMRCVVMLLS